MLSFFYIGVEGGRVIYLLNSLFMMYSPLPSALFSFPLSPFTRHRHFFKLSWSQSGKKKTTLMRYWMLMCVMQFSNSLPFLYIYRHDVSQFRAEFSLTMKYSRRRRIDAGALCVGHGRERERVVMMEVQFLSLKRVQQTSTRGSSSALLHPHHHLLGRFVSIYNNQNGHSEYQFNFDDNSARMRSFIEFVRFLIWNVFVNGACRRARNQSTMETWF